RDKMSAPTYRDIPAAEIPTFTDEGGVRVKAIAGEVQGVAGAVSKRVTEPVIVDIGLPAGRPWTASLPTAHNAFVYVYEGVVTVGDRAVPVAAGRMGILTTDPAADGVALRVADACPGGLAASGFRPPTLFATQLVGGALLLLGMVPLGVVILAPVIVHIVEFHVFLAPAGLPPAIVVAALAMFLAWTHRPAYRPLF